MLNALLTKDDLKEGSLPDNDKTITRELLENY